MSRVILSKHPDGSDHFVVGWDHPAGGAFWQEWVTQEELKAAEAKMEEAERTGIGPHSETVQIAETGVKREGGMWPGIPLSEFESSLPEDLRSLVTPDVMGLLYQHAEDPDSSYNKQPIDLTRE